MLVEYNGKSPPACGSHGGGETNRKKNVRNSGIAIERRREAGFDQHTDPEVGPPDVQGGNGRRFQNDVA
jgi:hypothetical protein